MRQRIIRLVRGITGASNGRPRTVVYDWCDACRALVEMPCTACAAREHLARRGRALSHRSRPLPDWLRCAVCGTQFRPTAQRCPACGAQDAGPAQREEVLELELSGADEARRVALVAQQRRGCPLCGNHVVAMNYDAAHRKRLAESWRCSRCRHTWPIAEAATAEDYALLAGREDV